MSNVYASYCFLTVIHAVVYTLSPKHYVDGNGNIVIQKKWVAGDTLHGTHRKTTGYARALSGALRMIAGTSFTTPGNSTRP